MATPLMTDKAKHMHKVPQMALSRLDMAEYSVWSLMAMVLVEIKVVRQLN